MDFEKYLYSWHIFLQQRRNTTYKYHNKKQTNTMNKQTNQLNNKQASKCTKNTIETNKLQDKQTSNCRTQRIKLTTNQQRHICYFDLFIVETRFCTHLTSEDSCLTQSPSLPKDAITSWIVGTFHNIMIKYFYHDQFQMFSKGRLQHWINHPIVFWPIVFPPKGCRNILNC